MPVVLAGGALNALAILANGGVDAGRSRARRRRPPTTPRRASSSTRPRTPTRGSAFLGDVIATPDALPLQNVYSPGDVVIVLGLLVVVHAACHVQNAASSRARPTGSS